MDRDDFYKSLLDNLCDGVYFLNHDRRITYWNRGAERVTGYVGAEVVGSRCADDILIHVDSRGEGLCTHRCPVARTLEDGEPREAEVYLHHREGHRIPVLVRVNPIRNGEGRIVGAVEVFTDNSPAVSARRRIGELERLSLLDTLTGVGNRRCGEMNLRSRIGEMRRYGWPFGLIFIDIDHFKRINDLHSHEVGDRVLRMVAKTLVSGVRSFDAVSRWGGEEFISVVTNVEEGGLRAVAERARALVASSGFSTERAFVSVTVSVGAAFARPDDSAETLLERADRLMYRSKEAGRNRVTCEGEAGSL